MMSKKLFILFVVTLSLSLIGIIVVQVYFIKNSLKNEEKQFTLNAKRSLSFVSVALESIEFNSYASKMHDLIASGVLADSTTLKELTIKSQDESTNRTIIYRNAILEESFKVPSMFFDIGLDSISISRLTNKRDTRIYDDNKIDGNLNISPEKTIIEFSSLPEVQKRLYELTYRDQFKNYPIYKRVSAANLKRLLKKQLRNEGIEIDFEFAIYDKDLATKVQSDNFEFDAHSTYGVPLFVDNHNESDYKLYVNFPNRNKYLFSSILGMTFLSVLFTLIIIIAFWNAIYQLIRQRQISEIKTDFINNMTHEFKTPIATINLALDFIRNPKVIGDQEKVLRYLQMIKDENTRMHAQVENVLRISKLERNELNIEKDKVDLHELTEDAITHVALIVQDRGGHIKTDLKALQTTVLANDTHLTNVIVNILDNAIKYSDNAPHIDVYTENVGNNILLKISDQGNGMSKQVSKHIFEKFYREHTGNVHNVKGHGLGLSYVKRIVDDHQGHISVESEKGKGSTFTIRLPLIS